MFRDKAFRPFIFTAIWVFSGLMFSLCQAEQQPVLSIDNAGTTQAVAVAENGAAVGDFALGDVNASVTVEVLDSFQAEQERMQALVENKPAPYIDKVMSSDLLTEFDLADRLEEEQPDGFRSYFLEARFNTRISEADGTETDRFNSGSLRGGYRQETLNYGEFSVTANLTEEYDQLDGSRLHSEEFTLRNTGLPLTVSLVANTAAGDISSELTDAFERTGRLALGSGSVKGVSTRIFSPDSESGFDLRAGYGQRQSFSNESYQALDGTLVWLGYSRSVTDNTFVGFQFNQARGIPALSGVSSDPDDGLTDVDSVAVSLGYGHDLRQSGDKKLRLVWVGSRASAEQEQSSAGGLFIEAGFRKGRYQHEFGLYKSSDQLSFADHLLLNHGEGVHWRTDYSGLRLNMGGGLEYRRDRPARRDDGRETDHLILTANSRYRLGRERYVGGNFRTGLSRSASESGTNDRRDWSSYGSVYYQTTFDGWGTSRVIATLRHNQSLVDNGPAATGEELQWEHDWITGKYTTMRPEFKTTLGWAHDRSESDVSTYPTAGLSARYWVNSGLSLGVNLRATARDSNLSTSRGLSGSLNTEYEAGNGWRFGAAAHINQARVDVNNNDTDATGVTRSDDKSVYLYTRWDGNAGKPFPLLGRNRNGSGGSGSVSGVVYFDLNRDGEQQADEQGVAGVDVLLDGAYSSRTDRHGKFEFVRVTTGKHELSLDMNSVPLPWGESEAGNRFDVVVPLRGRIDKRIAVIRPEN